MSGKLLVVADLGRVKAYEFHDPKQEEGGPTLRLIEDWRPGVTLHLSQESTDHAGGSRVGVANTEEPSALSEREQHHLDLDSERRRCAMKRLAEHITELMDHQQPDELYFAADKRINQPVLDAMPERVRMKIQKNATVNLSKAATAQMLKRFSG
ncbi:MAG TPA: host attachment protein [Candidatus Saccharimonadales bacterium]|nr:host attachment protein [Candidatus Saccharimonadales bacterium]